MLFSVVIPTYEMHQKGVIFLDISLKILSNQTFKDFEVVISDHSKDDAIAHLCEKWSNRLDIKYLRNNEHRGNSSANVNNAIKNANGEWIKILFQDDFLASEHSLMEVYQHVSMFKPKWLATGCEHSNDGTTFYRPFYPKWNTRIIEGINTISSPSVIAFENNRDGVWFDDNLIWLMDVDFYWKKYKKYGKPYFLNSINVVNRTWGKQLSDTISNDIKDREVFYLKQKYKRIRLF